MERLQKILAHGGIASRRTAEQLIRDGRVRVNGVIVSELGAKADPRRDRVELDGKRVVAEDHVYVVLHKPRGVVATMSDPEGRPTVQELLKSIPGRVYPVGRLDFATSGVLLATNDGELADGLLHPRKAVPKTYVLKVKGLMKPEDLEQWRRGVRLEDGVTLPAQAKLIRHETDKTWFELTITEGRNQQIRRMGDATGFTVMRLARVAFAEVSAEGLAPGRWRYLTREELLALRKTYGVPRSLPAAPEMEEGTKRIQAKAVFVRGAAKGAAGRATRNAGAEKITARGRFSDSRASSEENWGERPDASASRGERPRAPTRGSSPREASWGASREADSPRAGDRRVPASRGGDDARPSRGRPDARAGGGDRPRFGAGARGPATRADEGRSTGGRGGDRPRSGASGHGAGARGGEAWSSSGGRGGDDRGGDRPRSGAGGRGPAERPRSGAGRGPAPRNDEAWGSGRGRDGDERGGDRPRPGAGGRGADERGGDRPRSSAGGRGPATRYDDAGEGGPRGGDRPRPSGGRGAGARGEDSRGAGRGAGARGEDSRGGDRPRPSGGRGAGARGEDSRGAGRGAGARGDDVRGGGRGAGARGETRGRAPDGGAPGRGRSGPSGGGVKRGPRGGKSGGRGRA